MYISDSFPLNLRPTRDNGRLNKAHLTRTISVRLSTDSCTSRRWTQEARGRLKQQNHQRKHKKCHQQTAVRTRVPHRAETCARRLESIVTAHGSMRALVWQVKPHTGSSDQGNGQAVSLLSLSKHGEGPVTPETPAPPGRRFPTVPEAGVLPSVAGGQFCLSRSHVDSAA